METQSDQKIRVVALANLRAMCERVSGTCHTYSVVKVSRSRVHVEYSNPSEYGTPDPMTAVFPCYPCGHETNPHGVQYNPSVVLDMLRVLNNRDGEGWQAFTPLLDCPTLWRGKWTHGTWQSHAEIQRTKPYDPNYDLPDTCVVCDLPVAYEAQCHACGWKRREPSDVATRETINTHTQCEPYRYTTGNVPVEIPRTPDVIVRAITRAEVQS